MKKLLLPALVLGSMAACAAPAPRMDGAQLTAITETYQRTIEEWSAAQVALAEPLKRDPAEYDRFLAGLSTMIPAFAAVSQHAAIRGVCEGTDGYLLFDRDLRSGDQAVVSLVGGPPGGSYTLYIADDLAAPVPVSDAEGIRGYWVLDTKVQLKQAEGTLDSRGQARILVPVDGARRLIGRYRVFQASVRAPSATALRCTTPVGGRIHE